MFKAPVKVITKNTNTQLYTGRMPFPSPNRVKAMKEKIVKTIINLKYK